MTVAISNAELGNWSSSPPDGRSAHLSESLYEVVDGCVVDKPAMGAYQTSVAINLLHFLLNHVRANKLGRANSEMLYLLDRDTDLKRRPDVSFVSYARWERTKAVPNTDAWDVVPELAVEVVSPSNSAEDMLAEVGEYFRAGCELVWVVYPIEKQIYVYSSPTHVHVLTVGDELDGEATVSNFKLPVADLFEECASES